MLSSHSAGRGLGRLLRSKRFAGIFVDQTDVFSRVFLVHRRPGLLSFEAEVRSAVAIARKSAATMHAGVDVSLLQKHIFPRSWLCFVLRSMCLILNDICDRLAASCLCFLGGSSDFIAFLTETVQQLLLGRRRDVGLQLGGSLDMGDEAAVASAIFRLELHELVGRRLRDSQIRNLLESLLVDFDGPSQANCVVRGVLDL